MKKLVAFAAVIAAISFASCGNKQQATDENAEAAPTEEAAPAAEAAPEAQPADSTAAAPADQAAAPAEAPAQTK